jgi:hypothetical protein
MNTVGDMEGLKWQGVLCVQVLDNLWLADLTQMQATRAMPLRADQGGFKVSADSGPMPS